MITNANISKILEQCKRTTKVIKEGRRVTTSTMIGVRRGDSGKEKVKNEEVEKKKKKRRIRRKRRRRK